jgi:hypothetical protein
MQSEKEADRQKQTQTQTQTRHTHRHRNRRWSNTSQFNVRLTVLMSASLRLFHYLERRVTPPGFIVMTVDVHPSHFSFNISQHFKSDEKGLNSYSVTLPTSLFNPYSDAVALWQASSFLGRRKTQERNLFLNYISNFRLATAQFILCMARRLGHQ